MTGTRPPSMSALRIGTVNPAVPFASLTAARRQRHWHARSLVSAQSGVHASGSRNGVHCLTGRLRRRPAAETGAGAAQVGKINKFTVDNVSTLKKRLKQLRERTAANKDGKETEALLQVRPGAEGGRGRAAGRCWIALGRVSGSRPAAGQLQRTCWREVPYAWPHCLPASAGQLACSLSSAQRWLCDSGAAPEQSDLGRECGRFSTQSDALRRHSPRSTGGQADRRRVPGAREVCQPQLPGAPGRLSWRACLQAAVHARPLQRSCVHRVS